VAQPTIDRDAYRRDLAHLAAFIRSRRGVEAFLEPHTMMTQTTVMLVADDGEWTRRRFPGVREARKFAYEYRIPCYDVALMGYPQRVRDYNARVRKEGGRLSA
jgi:hypothetical protein